MIKLIKKVYNLVVPKKIKSSIYKYRMKKKNKSKLMNNKDKFIKKIKKYDVISFDIFDTLVTRTIYKPDDLFLIMDEKLKKKYNFPDKFINMRKKSEHDAINKLNKDVNLKDIYNSMGDIYKLSKKDIEYIMNLEIELELFHLIPRYDMLEIFNELLIKNKQVIITSDMYLEEDTIIKILDKCGYKGNYKLYLSNSYNARKDTGKLFDIIVNEYKDKKIIHIGDNDISDVKIAKSKGIDSYKIYSSRELLQKTEYYNILRDDLENIDNSLVVGLFINKYLFNSPFASTCIDSLKDFSYISIAPFMFELIRNIVDSVKKEDKLLFLAREGYYLQKLYKDYVDIYKIEEIDNKYFLASRKATYNALIDSNDAIEKMIDKDFVGDIKSFAKQIFDIDYNEDNFDIILPRDKDIVFDKLSPYYRYIISESKLKRENYIKYIESNYPNYKKDNMYVVDLGYAGTIQYNLSKLLNKNISGIYLTDSGNRKKYKNNSKLIYSFDTVENSLFSKIFSYSLILEFFLSAPYGQLMYFKNENGNVVPVYNDEKITSKKSDDLNIIYDSVIEFFKDMKSLEDRYSFILNKEFVVKSFVTIVECNFISYKVKDKFDFMDSFDSNVSKNVFKIIGRY